jgi:hypothetical protein
MEVQTEFNERMVSKQPQKVTVVVSRPPDQNFPKASTQLKKRIATGTNREVTVEVEFVERQKP